MYRMETYSRPKIIAFDYDDTISSAPLTFLEVMLQFEKIGWQCVVVTYRQPDCSPEDLDFLREKGYKVYFTGQIGKEAFMLAEGVSVDIWVDDSPQTVIQSYNAKHGFFYTPM